ncbi:hypothetical protein [Peribacillus simplex]|nr:hypothetical protein [Peribacillus simplex]
MKSILAKIVGASKYLMLMTDSEQKTLQVAMGLYVMEGEYEIESGVFTV